MASSEKNFDCCPPFDPGLWDDKTFTWENKLFVRDKVRTFFYMPINFGKTMKRLDRKVNAAEANVPDWLCLSDHTSKWNMNLFLAVDKKVPGAQNTILNGNYYSCVYEGPFRDTEKWCKDFEEKAKAKGLTIIKWYMWYTTCPRCAKKYGKNYVTVIGQVE